MAKYITTHQYEPLRTPSSWQGSERVFVGQVQDALDGIYSRLNRLRYEDMAPSFDRTIKSMIGYRVEILADQGMVLTDRISETVLTAKVWQGSTDITDQTDASRFNWTRKSQDEMADAVWNDAHKGMKSVTVNTLDVVHEATFQCDITGEE